MHAAARRGTQRAAAAWPVAGTLCTNKPCGQWQQWPLATGPSRQLRRGQAHEWCTAPSQPRGVPGCGWVALMVLLLGSHTWQAALCCTLAGVARRKSSRWHAYCRCCRCQGKANLEGVRGVLHLTEHWFAHSAGCRSRAVTPWVEAHCTRVLPGQPNRRTLACWPKLRDRGSDFGECQMHTHPCAHLLGHRTHEWAPPPEPTVCARRLQAVAWRRPRHGSCWWAAFAQQTVDWPFASRGLQPVLQVQAPVHGTKASRQLSLAA
jgi:hypothetical protein